MNVALYTEAASPVSSLTESNLLYYKAAVGLAPVRVATEKLAKLHQREAHRAEMMRFREEETMLSLDECIGMSELTEDEVAVIAEHEHVPEIVAVELGHSLLKTLKGLFILKCYIGDVLEQAKLAGKRDKVKRLDLVLTQFNAAHSVPRVL